MDVSLKLFIYNNNGPLQYSKSIHSIAPPTISRMPPFKPLLSINTESPSALWFQWTVISPMGRKVEASTIRVTNNRVTSRRLSRLTTRRYHWFIQVQALYLVPILALNNQIKTLMVQPKPSKDPDIKTTTRGIPPMVSPCRAPAMIKATRGLP